MNALGGISMDFPYPVRDRDCTGVCYNNSGLTIPTAGCQVLNGQQALALSRSRYFEYYTNGEWTYDEFGPRTDPAPEPHHLGRAEQAKGTYNPLGLDLLLTSVVHDFSKDNGLSPNDLFALAERYHAFSGSQLQSYTLPTVPAYTSGGSAVEVVQPSEASQAIAQFLNGPFGPITTPPLDSHGNALTLSVPTTAPATGAAGDHHRTLLEEDHGDDGTARVHRPLLRPPALLTGRPTPAGRPPATGPRRPSLTGPAVPTGPPDGGQSRSPWSTTATTAACSSR